MLGLMLTALLLVGCGGMTGGLATTSTPVPPETEPTSVSSRPTSEPSLGVKLYLCESNDKQKVLTEECNMHRGNVQAILYPKYPNTKVDFKYRLSGDIQGNSYTFALWLASGGTTTFDVSIILVQNGAETTLATTSFAVEKKNFDLFSEMVTGLDPTTSDGDVLILRIFPASGVDGAVTYTDSSAETSYVTIPPVK